MLKFSFVDTVPCFHLFFWKEEASSFCWPCYSDHAAQTDLWLSNKEIESACWRYSSTCPQL